MAGGRIGLSMRKASKLIGYRGELSYPLPVFHWERDQGKAGTCALEVRMVAGGGAKPKKPTSLTWGKEGIGWGMESRGAHGSLGSYLGIFEKALGLFHT